VDSTAVGARATVRWSRDTDHFEVTGTDGPFGGYIEVLD
jgi:hypothetical protein